MKSEMLHSIAKLTRELGLQPHSSPSHGAEGLELRQQGRDVYGILDDHAAIATARTTGNKFFGL